MTFAGKLFRKTTLLEVVEERAGGLLVQNEGDSSDQWMISNELFASSYVQEIPGYSFEQMAEMEATHGFEMALVALKEGYRVTRKGWNGKGMWLAIVKHEDMINYPVNSIVSIDHPAYDYTMVPWIGMKTADDKFVPWLASQTDQLADDWMVLV